SPIDREQPSDIDRDAAAIPRPEGAAGDLTLVVDDRHRSCADHYISSVSRTPRLRRRGNPRQKVSRYPLNGQLTRHAHRDIAAVPRPKRGARNGTDIADGQSLRSDRDISGLSGSERVSG